MVRVRLQELDEWLFRGIGGIINMMFNRVKYDCGFSRRCKQLLDNEVNRLAEIKSEVDARQITEYPSDKMPFSVIDSWFIKSYEGINHWLDVRGREGPPFNPNNLDDLQKHVDEMQGIINRERERCNGI